VVTSQRNYLINHASPGVTLCRVLLCNHFTGEPAPGCEAYGGLSEAGGSGTR